MPTVAPPNGLVAPFWDDLAPDAQTRVRAATNGVAPNRSFTIEWLDAAFAAGGPERLTFQAKLMEATGVIEFHYCSLRSNGSGSSLLAGTSATIGLENGTGTETLDYSYNGMSISSGTGRRFTPQ